MSVQYAYIVLAVVALIAGILYMRVRRRRRKKKSAPPVRPASPVAAQTAGVASTWAPPAWRSTGRARSPQPSWCPHRPRQAGTSRRGIACSAGNLGCARCSAGCACPDVGFGRRTGAAGRSARACPDVGTASPPAAAPPGGPSWGPPRRADGPAASGAPSSRAGPGVGWGGCARTLVGCAAGRRLRLQLQPLSHRRRPRRRPPPPRGAVMERRPCRSSSRARVGSAGRLSSITHTDRAVVEPSGSGLERIRAPGLSTGCTRLDRLGRAAARICGATTDRRARLERHPPPRRGT